MPTTSHPALTALAAVLQDAGARLEIPVPEITVELLEAHVWPDRGLGLPGLGGGRALTPGYLVRLGDGSTYRTDQQGKVALEQEAAADPEDPRLPTPDTEIRLRYTREGGIGGWRTVFETDSDQLSPDEEAELRRLITEADFFGVGNAGPGPVVHDGFTSTLWIAVGRRNHEVVRGDGIVIEDTEELHALLAWAAERTPPLFPVRPVELS